jgi:hypothetical protein
MQPMNTSMQTRRILLYVFIASLCTVGLIGIFVLLRGNFGNLEGRVVASTAVACAASFFGMISAFLWERRRWHPIGLLGLFASPMALLATLAMIWSNYLDVALTWESLSERMAGTMWVVTIALPCIGLLSFAKLHKRFEWIRRWTIIDATLLGALLIYLILVQPPDHEFENLMRGVGILAIALVCGTLAIPVFHYISGITRRESQRTTDLQVEIICPRCATRQTLQAGRSQCVNCRLRFLIEIEEEQCPKCGYPCYLLASSVCPECGTTLNAAPLPASTS